MPSLDGRGGVLDAPPPVHGVERAARRRSAITRDAAADASSAPACSSELSTAPTGSSASNPTSCRDARACARAVRISSSPARRRGDTGTIPRSRPGRSRSRSRPRRAVSRAGSRGSVPYRTALHRSRRTSIDRVRRHSASRRPSRTAVDSHALPRRRRRSRRRSSTSLSKGVCTVDVAHAVRRAAEHAADDRGYADSSASSTNRTPGRPRRVVVGAPRSTTRSIASAASRDLESQVVGDDPRIWRRPLRLRDSGDPMGARSRRPSGAPHARRSSGTTIGATASHAGSAGHIERVGEAELRHDFDAAIDDIVEAVDRSSLRGRTARRGAGLWPTSWTPMSNLRADRARIAHRIRASGVAGADALVRGRAATPSVSMPPPKPVRWPLAPTTRWHGTMIGNGLRPFAAPTARALPGSPRRFACSP